MICTSWQFHSCTQHFIRTFLVLAQSQWKEQCQQRCCAAWSKWGISFLVMQQSKLLPVSQILQSSNLGGEQMLSAWQGSLLPGCWSSSTSSSGASWPFSSRMGTCFGRSSRPSSRLRSTSFLSSRSKLHQTSKALWKRILRDIRRGAHELSRHKVALLGWEWF